VPTSDQYQLTIIGSFTDGFHFYPITIDGERCTIKSTQTLMWPRNPQQVHGNVFKDSTLIGTKDPTTIARSPANEAATYPSAEVVLLNTTLINIAPEGWGEADGGGAVHFWEYNSHNPDGTPLDTSHRASWSRQLDAVEDARRIADYSRAEFVLAGWKPNPETP
jgi:pectinesterase